MLYKIIPAILNGIANLSIEELSIFLETEYDISIYLDQTVYKLFKLDIKGYCDHKKEKFTLIKKSQVRIIIYLPLRMNLHIFYYTLILV